MGEKERAQQEYEAMLRNAAQDIPMLDRRHKSIKDAVCLATARANRKAYMAARARVAKLRARKSEDDSCA